MLDLTKEDLRRYEQIIEPKRRIGPVLPMDQSTLEDLDRFRRDADYARKHKDKWRARFPDHWIVVYEEKLVIVEPSAEKMRESAALLGIPPSMSYGAYLGTDQSPIVL